MVRPLGSEINNKGKQYPQMNKQVANEASWFFESYRGFLRGGVPLEWADDTD